MSDKPQPPGPVKIPTPQEPSMERRLLLAFGLMAVFLVGSQYLFPPPAPPKKEPEKAPAAEKKAETVKPAPSPVAPAQPQTAASQETTHVIETAVYRVAFNNRGATVDSWILKNFKDNAGKPLELVNRAAIPKMGRAFSWLFKDRKPSVDLNQALFEAKPSADGLGIEFSFSDGKTFARRSFQFEKDRYLSHYGSEVNEAGSPVPHWAAWRGGFGDGTVDNAASVQHGVLWDAAESELVTRSASDAKDQPVEDRSPEFAGVEDQYFAAVGLPEGGASIGLITYQDFVVTEVLKAETAHVGVALGGEGRHQWALYVGPKDIDLLKRANPRLERLVDFGWFAIIAKPLFLVLHWFSEKYTHNYGWSIIVITVVINFLLLPLKLTNMKSMKKMQRLQPLVAAINEKYKGLSLRDPRKAQQNQEVMDLYKKHGVNPMGGCLPILLQIPFFIAYYTVLSVAIELRGASWLWVTDLSRPENLPIRLLPVAMIASQFALQKMTPSTTVDPMQQRIMLLMPLMFGFMFYGVSSGLVLYWLTSNLVGIAQQMYFNHAAKREAPAAVVAAPAPAKTKRPRK
ncbi:MAG: membrane protein insertase YidC [Bryobacteraceae bacterium]